MTDYDPRMRIYTKRGDDGSTGLLGGVRVSKSAARVGAYGAVDELNAVIGWVRAAQPDADVDEVLASVQEGCFRAGAFLASAPGADPGVAAISSADVEGFERAIDRCEDGLPPLRTFVLPGGGEVGARLHVARTVCRRAERDVVALARAEPVDPAIVVWLNRLSDLLFVLARWANRASPEAPWAGRKG
jgi:cob(I)alamin adenosyltransferase